MQTDLIAIRRGLLGPELDRPFWRAKAESRVLSLEAASASNGLAPGEEAELDELKKLTTADKGEGAMTRKVSGPTIMLGDGTYYDYTDPSASEMSIEDFAYGLAYTCRFRGQTRARLLDGRRFFYSVAEHSVRGAKALLDGGYRQDIAYDFLMHEGGEPVCGDDPGPMKPLCLDKKALEKRCEAAAHARFHVQMIDRDLIKHWDLRMLATEQRDLMPQSRNDRWRNAEDHPRDLPAPFDFTIVPWSHPNVAAEEFLAMFERIAPGDAKLVAATAPRFEALHG